MSRERQKSGRELSGIPSLRDYWNNPSGFVAPLSQPRRGNRTRPQVTTPSLWDSSTMQNRTEYQSSGRQVNEPTAFLPAPLEGEIVTENRQQLADRLTQYGVSSLSNAELLSLILRTHAGSERRISRVEELLAQYSVPHL